MTEVWPMATTEHSSAVAPNDIIHRTTLDRPQAAARPSKPKLPLSVSTINHDDAKRKNIPTAEHQSVIQKDQENVKQVPRNTSSIGQ